MQAHALARLDDGQYQCSQCGMTWKQRPSPFAACLGVPVYTSWPDVPEGLKTRTRLHEAGLVPGALPAGCYFEHRGKKCLLYWLYDEGQARPRRSLSEAQLAALVEARAARRQRHTCVHCRGWVRSAAALNVLHRCSGCESIIKRRNVLIRWAREVVADPLTAVIDVETTSLDGYILEIAVLLVDGTPLFHSLINPQEPISEEARRVHGISDQEVAESPTLAVVWNELEPVLRSHHLIAYNAHFDKYRLYASAGQYGLDGWFEITDLMQPYADYRNTRWWSLADAARSEGVKQGGHRALGDAQAALGVIRAMAGHEILSEVEASIEFEPGDDGIPF